MLPSTEHCQHALQICLLAQLKVVLKINGFKSMVVTRVCMLYLALHWTQSSHLEHEP